MTTEDRFELAYQDVEDFAKAKSKILKELIVKQPKTFSIRSTDESYNEGWVTGFRRCLAYMKQQAALMDKEKHE